MKRIAALLVLSVFIGSSASFASHHGGKQCQWSAEKQEKYVEKKMDKMTKAFNLDESQQAEVETILRDKMEKKKAVKQRMKDDMKEISEEFRSKMDGVLTEEQKPAFDKMIKKYESKKHKKRKKFFIF